MISKMISSSHEQIKIVYYLTKLMCQCAQKIELSIPDVVSCYGGIPQLKMILEELVMYNENGIIFNKLTWDLKLILVF